MKLMVVFIFALIPALGFWQMTKIKKKNIFIQRYGGKILGTLMGLGVVIIAWGIFMAINTSNPPDKWCTTSHIPTISPPRDRQTAIDYLNQGDYEFESGKCTEAIVNYSKAILLNPNYAEAYNNRAYISMREHRYKEALPDLNKALEIRPDYVNALMNRGDIYNYYLNNKQQAINDYEKVIGLVGYRGTSVCGHLFLAKHNGWNLGTILDIPVGLIGMCKL